MSENGKYKNVRDIKDSDIKSDDYSEEQIISGDKLFRKPCDFVLGVAELKQLPVTELPEIAFAGRSNVGKSSIINALTNRKGLARTSNTPGRTQELNFFNLGELLHIVDLPGYGFAKAPKNIVANWQKKIVKYLQGRVNLRRVFVLIDSRHGIKKVDEEIMDILDTAAVTYQVVLTKTDKVKEKELEKTVAKVKKQLSKHGAAYFQTISTSSAKNIGIDKLKAEIYKVMTF